MHYKKGNDFDMILENTTKTVYNAPKRPKLRKRQLEQIRNYPNLTQLIPIEANHLAQHGGR